MTSKGLPMRFLLPSVLAAGLLLASGAVAAPDGGDSGHHPGPVQRPLDSSHNRRPPGPHGRERFNRFDTFHNISVSPRRFHAGPYRKPLGWHYRLWGLGELVPAVLIAQGYWIDDYRAYDLVRPPFGCVWVRYGNDAILVDRRTGEVLRVVRDVFY